MNTESSVTRSRKDFDSPEAVVASDGLSPDQKIAILEDWRVDLIELQTAADENMAARQGSGAVAEELRQVTEALKRLRGG